VFRGVFLFLLIGGNDRGFKWLVFLLLLICDVYSLLPPAQTSIS